MTRPPWTTNRPARRLAQAWLAALAVLALPAQADWAPPPPMPDEFDWVQLVSGEWLKGEIRAMYQDTMEFDSEELDLLSLDLEDITVIRSAQRLAVRFDGERIASGKLLLEGDDVTVIDGESQERFTRGDLLTISRAAKRRRDYWSGDVSVGGNFRSGNTEQTELSVSAALKRRTVDSRATLDYLANFTRNNGIDSANNHRLQLNWDRFMSDKFFIRPLFGEWYRDPFQNIEARYTVGTGAGYQIIDSGKTDWSVFAGPSRQSTKFLQVEEGAADSEGSWALSIGTDYETELTKWLDFTYEYSAQITSEAAGKYNHHMVGTLEFDLVGSLDLDVSLVWDRIESPKRNADGTIPEKNDYRLILGLGYDF
jgi:putative salt-induced outer membrane protein YdiY